MDNFSQSPAPSKEGNNIFMIMSLVMGIMAFLSSSFIFGAIVAGGMSILFAILSKGRDSRMQTLPKIGILTSLAGIGFSIVITTAMFFLVFANEENREQFMTMYNEMYEEMYGESFEDALKEAYPYLQEK